MLRPLQTGADGADFVPLGDTRPPRRTIWFLSDSVLPPCPCFLLRGPESRPGRIPQAGAADPGGPHSHPVCRPNCRGCSANSDKFSNDLIEKWPPVFFGLRDTCNRHARLDGAVLLLLTI